jgi:hypothetical protein
MKSLTLRLLAVSSALWAIACEPSDETNTPETPDESMEDLAVGPGAAPPPETAAPTAQTAAQPSAQIPQDRDPEEERRKMSLSRERSKKAIAALDAGRLTQAISEARQALKIHEQNVESARQVRDRSVCHLVGAPG